MRLQYVIADQNTKRGTINFVPPKQVTKMDAWYRAACKQVGLDPESWGIFNSYASDSIVYFDLRIPNREFKATLVIDRKAQ